MVCVCSVSVCCVCECMCMCVCVRANHVNVCKCRSVMFCAYNITLVHVHSLFCSSSAINSMLPYHFRCHIISRTRRCGVHSLLHSQQLLPWA